MQGDDGYAVLSGLEADADKVVEAAESNEAVADAARKAADAANGVAEAVDGMRGDVSRSLKEISGSLKSMGAAASPIADMQDALEADRASMAEALGALREISAAMRTFESLGGTQHEDGTNGGAWAPDGMGALAEGITGPIVAAIKELTEKGKSEAETQRSAVTSTTRTTSEAATRVGERIDGSFARLSDAFSASMRDLMDAEQRRHEESMRRIDAMQSASSGIDRAQAIAGSAVQVENLLRDALRGGFDVRRLAPQLASAIGSAFPALAEGFEHAENLKALPQKAAQQAASKVRPDEGDEGEKGEVDEPAPRSPEEQDAKDVENVRDGVLSALRDHDGEVERNEDLKAGMEHEEAVSVIEEGTESIPQAVGESVADEVSDSASQQQQGLADGLDAATQPEQAMGFGGSLLDRAIGLVSGTRMGRALGKTKVGKKALGMAGASAVGKAAVEAGASAAGAAAGAAGAAAGAEAAGSAVAKALGTAGEAIGGAVSKALGPIGLALTAYEGVQSALDIGQGLANASISQTGRADAVQGASISAQLGAQRAFATMTSALTDDQAQSIQDTLTSSGMRYDDEDFSEAFEFAKQMNQRYGVDVTQAARQYVDSVKRGTSSTEQLYKSMDLLSDVSDRTGQSFTSLREGYEKAVDDLTDSTGSSSLANAIANAVLEAGGDLGTISSTGKNLEFINSQPYAAAQYNDELDNVARQYVNSETNKNFESYAELQAYAEKTGNQKMIGSVQYKAASSVMQDNGYGEIATIMETGNAGTATTSIGKWSIPDLFFGDKSEFTSENRDKLSEEIADGIRKLHVLPESNVDVTQSRAMEMLGEHFDSDGKLGILGNTDIDDFSRKLVDEFISINETDENVETDITTQQSRQEAISNESGLIDTSADNGRYLSGETTWWSLGTKSVNEDELYKHYHDIGGFDTVEVNGHPTALYRVDEDGVKHYIPSSFTSPDGNQFMRLVEMTSAEGYGGDLDYFDDNVTDDETDLLMEALLKGNYINKEDFTRLSPEVATEITRELSNDFSDKIESGEYENISEYFSSNRDNVTENISGIVDSMLAYRESNGIDLSVIDNTNMSKEIQNIGSMLSNGLSMDVTLSADGVGNIATAVANCQTKSSSDAGTNG